MTAVEIHNGALAASKDLKTHYVKLFEILLIAETRQIYYQFNIPSLHTYCVELLDLSKHTAHDFVTVVRKSLEVPELAQALREGKLTISKARKICPVINDTNHKEWIDLARSCSCRIIEKAVAMANPKAIEKKESLIYVTGDVLELRLSVGEEWAELLTKTKDLLSTKAKKSVSTEEALSILMKAYCEKNDPVEKAKRALAKAHTGKFQELKRSVLEQTGETMLKQITETALVQNAQATLRQTARTNSEISTIAKPEPPTRSRYLPAEVEHLVDLRDHNQCSFVDQQGKRCESKRWLHKHHIKAFAQGGEHTPDNLETLCSGHHKARHLKLDEARGTFRHGTSTVN